MRMQRSAHTRLGRSAFAGTASGWSRVSLTLVGALTLAVALLTGTAPASAAPIGAVLTVTAINSAATAVAGKDVVLTVTVTNSGTSTLDLSSLTEYEGHGASIGLWTADPATCSMATKSGGVGGSENVCFERFDTGSTAPRRVQGGRPDGRGPASSAATDPPDSLPARRSPARSASTF